jgi:hypothetical protein
VIFGFLTLNFKTGFADKHNQCVPMNELINHIENTASPGSYKPVPSITAERSGFDGKRDISKTS